MMITPQFSLDGLMRWLTTHMHGLYYVGWLLGAVALFLTVARLIPDEKPLPETAVIRALAQNPSAELPLKENWFAFVFGYLAAADVDPFVAGAGLLTEVLNGKPPPAVQVIPPLAKGIVCSPCTEDAANTLRRTHQTLLTRYVQMQSATHFHSPLPASHKVLLPDFGPVLDTQALYLALLSAQPADADSMAAMEADLQFWRRALADTNVMLAKRTCLQAIRANLQARALLAEKRQEAGPLADFRPILRLTEAELSMLHALRHELAIDYAVMNQLSDFLAENMPARWDLRLLPYQPVRTFNLHLEQNNDVLRLAASKAAELANGYTYRPPRLHRITKLDYLFNTTGVWVLDLTDATHLYGYYMLAAHDVDALVVLVNLVEELARKGKLRELDRASFAELSRPYTNPYAPTETASWSDIEHRIYFNTRPGDLSKIRIPLSIDLPPK
jgi:hypothetical protein